jgi:hypothetical protein
MKKPATIARLFSVFKEHRLRFISFLLLPAMLNVSGCSFYYRVNSVYPPEARSEEKIENLEHQGKRFLILLAEERWYLRCPEIDKNRSAITGQKQYHRTTAGDHHYPKLRKIYKYKFGETAFMQEVHVHVREYAELENDNVFIPFSAIEKIEVFNEDKPATTASWFVGTTTAAFGALMLMGFLITLSYWYSGE